MVVPTVQGGKYLEGGESCWKWKSDGKYSPVWSLRKSAEGKFSILQMVLQAGSLYRFFLEWSVGHLLYEEDSSLDSTTEQNYSSWMVYIDDSSVYLPPLGIPGWTDSTVGLIQQKLTETTLIVFFFFFFALNFSFWEHSTQQASYTECFPLS